jgi:hypothetical protein
MDYLGYAPDIGNVNIFYSNLQNLCKVLQFNNYKYDKIAKYFIISQTFKENSVFGDGNDIKCH